MFSYFQHEKKHSWWCKNGLVCVYKKAPCDFWVIYTMSIYTQWYIETGLWCMFKALAFSHSSLLAPNYKGNALNYKELFCFVPATFIYVYSFILFTIKEQRKKNTNETSLFMVNFWQWEWLLELYAFCSGIFENLIQNTLTFSVTWCFSYYKTAPINQVVYGKLNWIIAQSWNRKYCLYSNYWWLGSDCCMYDSCLSF